MKNKQNNIEQGVKKITLLSSTIIILIVATIIGFTLINTEYTNFTNHIKSFKNTLVEREKFYIKTSLENLLNDIQFEEESILNNKKDRIEKQSIIAQSKFYVLDSEDKIENFWKTRKLGNKSLNENKTLIQKDEFQLNEGLSEDQVDNFMKRFNSLK